MTNIYVRQMQQLGLNPKQYAELINIPYGVVKDFIYGREGDYEMGLKDLLRRNMVEKHQEIEENFEVAKLKALEIKHNESDIDYIEWYNNEYSIELLKRKLKVSSITEFEKKYRIMVNGLRASHWFYTILCGKKEYDEHTIKAKKKKEFVSQLYDILVNDNSEKYKEKTPLANIKLEQKKTKAFYLNWYKTFDCKKFMKDNNISNSTLEEELEFSPSVVSRLINKRKFTNNALVKLYDFVYKTTENIDYFNWYKNFDLKEYMLQNKLTNSTLGSRIGLGIVSTSQLANKRFYTRKTLEKLYNYIKENQPSVEKVEEEPIEETIIPNYDENVVEITNEEEFDENNVVSNNSTSEKVDNHTPQIVSNNDILRKLLANRLTEEERELIRIFGGVID